MLCTVCLEMFAIWDTWLSSAIILWVCSPAAAFDALACPQPQLPLYIYIYTHSGLSVVCHDSRAWNGEYGRETAHSKAQLWSIDYRVCTQWILGAYWRHLHSKCLWHRVRIPAAKVTLLNKIVNLLNVFIITWHAVIMRRTPTCSIYIQISNGALTLRRLMSYIYGAPILDVSRSHTTTQHSR